MLGVEATLAPLSPGVGKKAESMSEELLARPVILIAILNSEILKEWGGGRSWEEYQRTDRAFALKNLQARTRGGLFDTISFEWKFWSWVLPNQLPPALGL